MVTRKKTIKEILKEADGTGVFTDHVDQLREAFGMNETRETSEEEIINKDVLERRLKDSYLIVGGGAWQDLWECSGSQKAMGFNSAESEASDTPSIEDLKSSMHPELLKRFRDDVIFLPKMSKEDYLTLVDLIGSKLPIKLRKIFIKLGKERVQEAVSKDLGMRYFETLMSDTLIINQTTSNPKIEL